MDKRFTPSAHTSRTMRSVRLSGFASIVHSTSGTRCMESDSVYKSMDSRESPRWLGVPPPIYTVSIAPSSPSFALRRICRHRSSTYASISGESAGTADVAKSQYPHRFTQNGRCK